MGRQGPFFRSWLVSCLHFGRTVHEAVEAKTSMRQDLLKVPASVKDKPLFVRQICISCSLDLIATHLFTDAFSIRTVQVATASILLVWLGNVNLDVVALVFLGIELPPRLQYLPECFLAGLFLK